MNAPTTFPPAEPIGMAQLREADRKLDLRTLFERFERDQMEAGVDLLLEMLDALDGDLDVEANGDELDFSAERFAASAKYESEPFERDGRLAEHRDAAIAIGESDDDEDDEGEEEPDAEFTAWPERERQPDYMLGGVSMWNNAEDDEPRHVPASMDRPMAENDA